PKSLDLGLGVAEHVPFGKAAAAALARRNIARMAHQFIVGEDPDSAVDALERLWRHGTAFTVDLLGEKTVTDADANRYAARVADLLAVLLDRTRHWPPAGLLERAHRGPLPRVN